MPVSGTVPWSRTMDGQLAISVRAASLAPPRCDRPVDQQVNDVNQKRGPPSHCYRRLHPVPRLWGASWLCAPGGPIVGAQRIKPQSPENLTVRPSERAPGAPPLTRDRRRNIRPWSGWHNETPDPSPSAAIRARELFATDVTRPPRDGIAPIALPPLDVLLSRRRVPAAPPYPDSRAGKAPLHRRLRPNCSASSSCRNTNATIAARESGWTARCWAAA